MMIHAEQMPVFHVERLQQEPIGNKSPWSWLTRKLSSKGKNAVALAEDLEFLSLCTRQSFYWSVDHPISKTICEFAETNHLSEQDTQTYLRGLWILHVVVPEESTNNNNMDITFVDASEARKNIMTMTFTEYLTWHLQLLLSRFSPQELQKQLETLIAHDISC